MCEQSCDVLLSELGDWRVHTLAHYGFNVTCHILAMQEFQSIQTDVGGVVIIFPLFQSGFFLIEFIVH